MPQDQCASRSGDQWTMDLYDGTTHICVYVWLHFTAMLSSSAMLSARSVGCTEVCFVVLHISDDARLNVQGTPQTQNDSVVESSKSYSLSAVRYSICSVCTKTGVRWHSLTYSRDIGTSP